MSSQFRKRQVSASSAALMSGQRETKTPTRGQPEQFGAIFQRLYLRPPRRRVKRVEKCLHLKILHT